MSTYQWKHCKNNKTKKKMYPNKTKILSWNKKKSHKQIWNWMHTEKRKHKQLLWNMYRTILKGFDFSNLSTETTSKGKHFVNSWKRWTPFYYLLTENMSWDFEILYFIIFTAHESYYCNLDKWTWNKNHGHKINRYWSFQSSTYS